MQSALVLNATYEPLSVVPVRRAVCLVLSEKAEIVHDDVVVFNFTIADLGQTFHDTAVIRDGRIAVLSTMSYSE